MTKENNQMITGHKNIQRIISGVKWIILSITAGLIVGSVAVGFLYAMAFVTGFRASHPWMLFFLPLGGLVIVWLYHVLKSENNTGTNLVISAIHSGEYLPVRTAPLIILSTIITHALGGSAGRMGAAIQFGGSLGGGIGKALRLDEKDKTVMIMCGISAAFSTLFGTPAAAAVFAMEVISIGIMHYAALVPCVIAALVARGLASMTRFSPESFVILEVPDFTVLSAIKITIFAVLCALVSILTCVCFRKADALYKKYIKNPYLRVIAGACIVIALTLFIGSQAYSGAGLDFAGRCMEEASVRPEAFLLKILLTALTLGAGFKGGEIGPSLCIGAAFGCMFGGLIGFSPTLCTAVGMTAVFCGVTNCPITSLFLSFEFFGFAGVPYFLLAIAFSYMVSGYFGLYRTQKIMYSKYKTNYINRKTV